MSGLAVADLTPDVFARMLDARGGIDAVRYAFMDTGSYRLTVIGGLAGRYLDSLRFDNYSERTFANRQQTLSWLAFDHPTLEPDAFTHDLLRAVLERHWSTAAPNTKAGHVSALRVFFDWCYEHGHVPADPARRLKPPRLNETERRSHSQDTIRKLVLAQDDRRDRVALLTMYWCGLRRNELRVVQFRHVNLTDRLLTVFGKGGTVIDQNIPGPLALALERHIQDRVAQPDEFLLYPFKVGRRGAWPTYESVVIWEDRMRPLTQAAIDKWFVRCRDRAGMPDVVMHELRHSAGTHMQEAGHDLLATQYFMRHKSAATTERTYIHVDRAEYVRRVQRTVPDPMVEPE